MADHESEQQRALEAASEAGASDDAAEDEASSPFDHPAFLPVILWGMALWFGIDGWFNPNIKSVMFNRIGFPVLALLGTYFTYDALPHEDAACPKCGQPIRQSEPSTALIVILVLTTGALGLVLYAAFSSFRCASHGAIAMRELPPSARRRKLTGLAMAFVAVAFVAAYAPLLLGGKAH
jgi:hypothetical protein